MNISSKPSPSSIPRKSTLLKSSDVCILCTTNTRHACIVVKSEEEAADTGSLLTHFICLALGLLSIKQMERNV